MIFFEVLKTMHLPAIDSQSLFSGCITQTSTESGGTGRVNLIRICTKYRVPLRRRAPVSN